MNGSPREKGIRWKDGIATMLDQAWLSFLNLAIAAAFIRLAPKEDYGIYLLLQTPLLLVQGLQNALLLSPLATVLPAAAEERKPAVRSTAIGGQVVFLMIAAALGGVLLAIWLGIERHGLEIWLPAGFALAIAGASAREGARALHYSAGEALHALRSDLVYGAGLLLALAALTFGGVFETRNVLPAIGIAALWPYALRLLRRPARANAIAIAIDGAVLAQFWACGRWALIGVLVTWINLNAYTLVVGAMLGLPAVADINAARLFLMPVALAVTAWSNLARPRISAWMAQQRHQDIRRFSMQSIFAVLAILAVFAGAVTLAYPLLEPLLGPGYRGLLPLILMWALFFAFAFPRNILMATLMTRPEGYRQLQKVSWAALGISLGGLWLLTAQGTLWVVAVLILVEFTQLGLIGHLALRWWKGTPQ